MKWIPYLLVLGGCLPGGPGSGPCADTLATRPEIGSAQLEVVFGATAVGERAETTVGIRNSGGGTLSLLGADVERGLAFVVPPLDAAAELAAGCSAPVTLEFAPTTPGVHTDTLVVTTDIGSLEIPVTGVGDGADIQPSTKAVEFGPLPEGCTRQHSLLLYNYGTRDGGYTVDFDGEAGPFELLAATQGSVAADDLVSLAVRFTAPESGSFSASLQFETLDAPVRSFRVPLTGATAAPVAVDEVFVQPADGAVDVLIVLDSGGSSSQVPGHVAAQASALVDELEAVGADYHLAVVSADGVGELEGVPRFLTPESDDVRGALAARMEFVSSLGEPWMLHNALTALDPARLGPDGFNAGFRRPGAALRVISISARADASFDVINWLPQQYVEGIGMRLDQQPLLRFGDVSGGVAGCSGAVTAEPSADLVVATLLTGGISASLCAEQPFAGFGPAFEHHPDRVYPSQSPEPETLAVEFDGEPTDAWTYNAADDSVILDPPPPAGTGIRLSYFPLQPDCP